MIDGIIGSNRTLSEGFATETRRTRSNPFVIGHLTFYIAHFQETVLNDLKMVSEMTNGNWHMSNDNWMVRVLRASVADPNAG